MLSGYGPGWACTPKTCTYNACIEKGLTRKIESLLPESVGTGHGTMVLNQMSKVLDWI